MHCESVTVVLLQRRSQEPEALEQKLSSCTAFVLLNDFFFFNDFNFVHVFLLHAASFPGGGTKISHASWHGQNKKKWLLKQAK